MNRTPVSDELREAILKDFQSGKMTHGVLGFERGTQTGEIIVITVHGRTISRITEDNNFIYFETPSGTEDRKAPKDLFLRDILAGQSH